MLFLRLFAIDDACRSRGVQQHARFIPRQSVGILLALPLAETIKFSTFASSACPAASGKAPRTSSPSMAIRAIFTLDSSRLRNILFCGRNIYAP